jgi:hypothetical protein
MKGLIETLNTVGENVWAVLIISIGAGLAGASIKCPDLRGPAFGIITAGCTAFKGKSQ